MRVRQQTRPPSERPDGGGSAPVSGQRQEEHHNTAASPLDPIPDLLALLRCGTDGLTSEEATSRLTVAGPNTLHGEDREGPLGPVLRQLTHPLAILLWLAASLAFATQGVTLGVAIVGVIALNACFALIQERHAQNAVAALSRYLPQHAVVIRNGRTTVVDAVSVVPGDVLVVREGDAICADSTLLCGAVEVDMSAINGESVPVARMPEGDRDPPEATVARVVEADDVLLSGTTCTAGEAQALVVLTGMSTELGRIATLSRRSRQEPSPLERQVRRVAWLIAAVAVLVGVAFLPLGMLAGLSFSQAAVFAIGLLVANVPEGLLPTITLALAVGVGEMARRGGLVKRLSAIETLGSTDVICTDKTGTLTQNRMTVHSVWGPTATATPASQGVHRHLSRALRTSTDADPDTMTGDPTDLALLVAAARTDAHATSLPRTATYRFDPRIRLMSVAADTPAGTLICTRAPPRRSSRDAARCSAKVAPSRTSPWPGVRRSNNGSRSSRPKGCASSAAPSGP